MTGKSSGAVVGVDVGGTFTDLVELDPSTGRVRLAKVPSTLDNQAYGVLAALDEAGCDLAALDLIVHGTTTTTNAVLERKLARTGLITTRGFRDVLELGRRTRPQPYGMTGTFTPLIPRNLRLEVPERMDASGEVVVPLDENAVHEAAQTLLDAGCESVVIHFLHAYANPAHECRAAEIVSHLWPNDHVTMGHALLSESREFERGVTAAANAAVQPLLDRYIRRLVRELQAGGYAGDVLVMNGNGGMVSSTRVAKEAAKTVMSGPASGVMAAAYSGRKAGIGNLITYDMGGTSTDVALIRDAEPSVSNEIEIEYAMPIHVPMVDVRTVGAGGGSIARVNPAGLLEVGPDSAGADPGPICYGKGGAEPTISDANLLLGRLDPARLNAVKGGVSLHHVRQVFARKLGDPLGLSADEAAAAVIEIANMKMAGAIRMVSISLGADPRDFALFAFGGAGPLHAAALARELHIPRILVPSRPGITNAIGCVVADLRHDFVNTINTALDSLEPGQLAGVFAAQIAEGEDLIAREAIDITATRHLYSVDMQFVGQTHLLRVPLGRPDVTAEELQTLFEAAYFRRFRVELDDIRANLVNANTSVIGKRAELDLGALIDPAGRKSTLEQAQTGVRPVYFDNQWRDTPIYWRDHLPADFTLPGPAIIQQMDTTLLIEPGDTATGDADGNILIGIGARA
ncbi:hydantoinase/oxoprolinase family protein [Sedimentitalea todarodis]|uniref:Hydantoinase/oxoprolinase family protein n=1 Tax=Sedimentitalea todarodis TaxID=1631240 RepID=A0ABU3V8C1_9RHOB|nr:hydantoinase/oxoprolinase family protein [Sedimentitalea todarodis]MDU9002353.1 hydantoinase/oxoprolinase family protein [Sedimentitalea todarodis]